MKKLFLILLIFIMIITGCADDKVVIPKDAIRFRVLANSNSPYDQKLKEQVRDSLQKELYNVLKDSKSSNEVRVLINDNMNNFKTILDDEMKNQPYSYTIDYGIHEFPEKIYKGVTYEAGDYESLLVTLGAGEGDNWWCVLFPPLCLIEAEESTEVEYKFFIKELIEKYF